jgi:hypothetical protein
MKREAWLRCLQGHDLLFGERGQEHAEPIHISQERVRLEQATDKGIPLEERVASPELSLHGIDVQGLQITADVKHRIAVLQSQLFDLRPGSEVVVDSVAFTWPRRPAVEQHEMLEPIPQLWMKLGQRRSERTLSHAGGPAQDDETPGSGRSHISSFLLLISECCMPTLVAPQP